MDEDCAFWGRQGDPLRSPSVQGVLFFDLALGGWLRAWGLSSPRKRVWRPIKALSGRPEPSYDTLVPLKASGTANNRSSN